MNKIMPFVQPIRLGHMTSHMSTNLYQSSSSTLFTTTTTDLPQHPLPPSLFPPHHHLHDMSKHGYDSQNTPATVGRNSTGKLDMSWLHFIYYLIWT